MKKTTIFILAILLFPQLLLAQNNTKNYTSLWKKVHAFELEALPKSALLEVEKIYDKAKRNNNSPQIIKTLIYKSKFALTLEENAQLSIINNIKSEISNSKFPLTNILESVLADMYWQYFQQNRWKIYNRTKTTEKVDAIDFRTWDINTLFEEINLHYKKSLSNQIKLQQTGLTQYNSILNLTVGSKEYRPSLFDFIGHRALNFYKNDESYLTKPAYKFELADKNLIAPNIQFVNIKIVSKDSLSQHLWALKLYQNLTKFHLKDKNPSALVNLTLTRLNFVKTHGTFINKDSIYLNSLLQLKELYKNNLSSTEIDFEIAKLYQAQGATYNPKSNTETQFKNTQALEICDAAIKKFPNSKGAEKCKILRDNITQKSIHITIEKYVPINKPARLLVNYKNTDRIYFSAFKISKNQQKKFYKINNDSLRIAFIKKRTPIKNWNTILRNEKDYQQHKTEVILPQLPHDNYMIFATVKSEKITTNKTFAYSFIQVTNIALIQNNDRNLYAYQVVDRNTGKPIKNAEVNLKNYNTGRYNKVINTDFKTDKNGQFSFKSTSRHQNVVITVRNNSDVATFSNFYLHDNYYNNASSELEHTELKSFIFTDRSIYRPGQTVYFKAIVLKKQGEKTEVFTKEYVEVILYDTNNQEIKKLDLKLNEFGTVSGDFILPTGGLTGEYQISIDESIEHKSEFYDNEKLDFGFSYSSHTFSVEEYKRPKFEAVFNPITATFQLNDSITIDGTATAYAGSSITNAKVEYRVVRTAQFPRWYNWYARSSIVSEELEITYGVGITDESGNFSIRFKAIPDVKISKENQPTFNYKVIADITDINGETRSVETNVKVGYHAMTATLSIQSKIDKTKKDNKFTITTNNLNNESVPTKGNIKIYKLSAPHKPLRKRPWEAPDYQLFTKSEFQKLFPHDAYSNENDVKNWKKSTLVFETDFDTSLSKEIDLHEITNWISGKYIIELTSTDAFDQKVKDEQRFTVFSADDKTIADNKLFFITTNKTSYKPTEKVALLIGSASKNITVTLSVEKNNKIVSTYFIHLNNETKTITLPVNSEDIGGFAIKYHYVNYNSFGSGTQHISVPYPVDDLQIETISFRDKLQPGSTQTWSFKIKGDKSDKVAAEVLASMYDASLDQFKNHDWSFNPIEKRSYYSYGNSSARQSFGNNTFTIRNQYRSYFNFPQQQYDKLNWFGFRMNSNRWANKKYLTKIALRYKPSAVSTSSDRTKKKGYIYGTVTDETGPLPGVSIIIKGTTRGTETDFDGKYSIKAVKGKKLIFSFIGYISTEVKIGKKNIINVLLASDAATLDEVVVTALGVSRDKKSLGYSVQSLNGMVSGVEVEYDSEENIRIRGNSSLKEMNNPLYIVDGVPVENFDINGSDIIDVNVLKDGSATAIYGARAANGVVIITTKTGQAKIDAEMTKVHVRKNLQETAFFFPQLKTDKDGNISFEFTAPEALTRWKLQVLAHTKNLKTATKTLTSVTQKELMVIPNPPRFLRERDQITFSSKIANLTDKKLNGFVQLVLTDAITGKNIDDLLENNFKNQTFKIDAKGNTNVSWNLTIPKYRVQAVQYKIIAKSGTFSDGEQNALPVLSNRMLVTETLPMWIKSNETKTFTLDKLASLSYPDSTRFDSAQRPTLNHHKLTLEITSNPAWYAVQALPYLMEYPYECAEQTFSRYYANALATHIATSNPRIQEVFKLWGSTDALVSNLEKNEELKSMIIQETPWLRDAQSETAQKKRIALLFDLDRMKNELDNSLRKLEQMQFNNGGFPWFNGSRYPNRYITQHIASGFGHLNKLGVLSNVKIKKIINKSVRFLDDEIINDYSKLLKKAAKIRDEAKTISAGKKNEKDFLKKKHVNRFQLHYLYMRSFYSDIKMSKKLQTAYDYYVQQSETYWTEFNLYSKGMIALVHHRNNNKVFADKILKTLKENSITNDELGMYWKSNTAGFLWYQAPVETQALMIEVFSEIENDIETVDNLKIWLLKNKQTNSWKTTKATTEAVYALLIQGSEWLEVTDFMDVKIGSQKMNPLELEESKVEAGTGYFKTSFYKDEIKPEMATVTLTKNTKGIAWGALYWQYFEDLDKITSAETPLKLSKKLFLKKNTDTGEELLLITDKTLLKLGDLVRVRIELKVDRIMEFVHMKDMRASGFEPINVLSQYKYQDGLGYYESTKDASTNFFFDRLQKGVYVFEYDLRVNNQGNFSNGITTIQSMYAPEFSSHSKGIRVKIVE